MSKFSVLIVEDNPIVAMMLEDEVSELGYVVVGPAASEEAAYALAKEHRPSIALVDIDLDRPQAGVSLAERIYKDFEIDSVYVSGQTSTADSNCEYVLGLFEKPVMNEAFTHDLAWLKQLLEDGTPDFEPRSIKLYSRARELQTQDS